MKNWKIWLVLSIFIIGAGIFYYSKSQKIQTVHPKVGPIVEAVYGIGTVTSEKIFQIKYGVPQTIEAIYVKEGDFVKAGSPLIKTDMNISRAPFSGTITSLPFHVGENVFAQTPILTIMDLKDRYLVVSLEQQGALRVKPGQRARIAFDSLRGQKILGIVRSIFPQNDQFLVHVLSEELPDQILPGMTADVAIEIDRRETAILIPVAALSRGKIILLKEGKREKIDVKVGMVDGQWAEITSPQLQESTEILIPKAQD